MLQSLESSRPPLYTNTFCSDEHHSAPILVRCSTLADVPMLLIRLCRASRFPVLVSRCHTGLVSGHLLCHIPESPGRCPDPYGTDACSFRCRVYTLWVILCPSPGIPCSVLICMPFVTTDSTSFIFAIYYLLVIFK